MDIKNLVADINRGKIDINNQQNFFSSVIKGLLVKLNEDISIRDIHIPHFILHTGDDILYVENKAKHYTSDPTQTSNENYIYNIIPRCMITPNGINFELDQLTSPCALGNLQLDYNESVYSLTGEFRRLPTKLGIEMVYYTNTYNDMLDLVQQIATKLAFIKTYHITYLGQDIICSYSIPDSFSGEWMTDLSGTTEDNRNKKVSLSIEIECNMPVWDNRTIMDSSHYISNFGDHGLLIYPTDGIKNKDPYEVVKWNIKTGESN